MEWIAAGRGSLVELVVILETDLLLRLRSRCSDQAQAAGVLVKLEQYPGSKLFISLFNSLRTFASRIRKVAERTPRTHDAATGP
jgi:hypothetical protein